MGIIQPMSVGTFWMIMFYFLCEFGDKATNRFFDLRDSIYGNWYLYPVDQQKYFILMILNANKPVYIEGFVIQCTRETYKKVKLVSIFQSLTQNRLIYFSSYYFQDCEYFVLIFYGCSQIYLKCV